MGKAKPFLEVLAADLKEDYGFLVLEIAVFAYLLITIILSTTLFGLHDYPGIGSAKNFTEGTLTRYTLSIITNPAVALLVTGIFFGLFVLKNIAYSFGNDLERGVIVSLLCYPLKRRSLFTAKLLSSIGVPFILFAALQFFLVILLAPGPVSIYVVLVSILAVESYPLVVAGIVLLITVRFKRGSKALMVGMVLYMASFMLVFLLLAAAIQMGSLVQKVASVLFPILALQLHYQTSWDPKILEIWNPSFIEALLCIGAGYILAFSILALASWYFERRLEI